MKPKSSSSTVFVWVLACLSICLSCSVQTERSDTLMTFNGPSADLRETKVVPTLDTPIPSGMSAVWCASFQSAWKAIEELAEEPIAFGESLAIAESLNKAEDIRMHIPQDSIYVACGWNNTGIVRHIQNDLKKRFLNMTPVTFPGAIEDSLIAYAYLETRINFPLAYAQNSSPMAFRDANGHTVDVSSFGILPEQKNGYRKLRLQPRVLFRKGDGTNLEFAVDLCADSAQAQIVVARISREPTLALALARIDKETAEMRVMANRFGNHVEMIGPYDSILVPDFAWLISHRFVEVESQTFSNRRLKGQRLGIARQDIHFRMNMSGVELKSEAKIYTASGSRTDYILNSPFLVCVKSRDTGVAYFAMWVDNAELMRPWQSTPQSAHR